MVTLELTTSDGIVHYPESESVCFSVDGADRRFKTDEDIFKYLSDRENTSPLRIVAGNRNLYVHKPGIISLCLIETKS